MNDRVTIYEVARATACRTRRGDPDRRQGRAGRPADRLRLHPYRGGELRQSEVGAADGRRRRGARRHRRRARRRATPRSRRTCKGYAAARAAGADEVAVFASASETLQPAEHQRRDRREPGSIRRGRRGGARGRDPCAATSRASPTARSRAHRPAARRRGGASGCSRSAAARFRSATPSAAARRTGRRSCCRRCSTSRRPIGSPGTSTTPRPGARQYRDGARLRPAGVRRLAAAGSEAAPTPGRRRQRRDRTRRGATLRARLRTGLDPVRLAEAAAFARPLRASVKRGHRQQSTDGRRLAAKVGGITEKSSCSSTAS